MPNFFLKFGFFVLVALALGIGAASFASFFGQQTTDNRQRKFLSEVEFKRAKIERKARRRSWKRRRNAQKND